MFDTWNFWDYFQSECIRVNIIIKSSGFRLRHGTGLHYDL